MSSTDKTAAKPEQRFQTLARQLEKLPPCQAQCPNSGDVRSWLGIIAQHEKIGLSMDEAYDEAWRVLAERNPLPATIGRICPHPCERLPLQPSSLRRQGSRAASSEVSAPGCLPAQA